MEILRVVNKGGRINTLENFHVFNIKPLDNQINDRCTAKINLFLDAIILNSTDKGHQ